MRNVGFKAVCIVYNVVFAIMDSSLFVVVLLPFFSFKIGFISASLGDSQLRLVKGEQRVADLNPTYTTLWHYVAA